MSDAASTVGQARADSGQSTLMVVGASSLGTMFEWYDFFLYGSLATYIAGHFFSGANEAMSYIFALGAFSAGFLVRPLGAVVFGRIGDLVGRKRTFLITMALMGVATFLVGILPTYAQIGIAAPIILVVLRLLQGLALGGEYGGAAVYVGEHSPSNKRGLHTSWINATASAGLLLSLIVILGTRISMTADDFKEWGWRVPFLLSVFLLGTSLWIRLRLNESPIFQRMKEEATTSRAPLAEAFSSWSNVKLMLIALFGATIGATTVWYTGQLYTLLFLERTLKVDGLTANLLVAIALAIAAPAYIFCGWLSDRIGRKIVMMVGLGLALLSYFPAFHLLTEAANPALARAQRTAPVTVYADPSQCSFQFDPIGRNTFDERSCDIAKSYLSKAGVSYHAADLGAGGVAEIHIGERILKAPDPRAMSPEERKAAITAYQGDVRAALDAAGYPATANDAEVNRPLVVAIVAYLSLISALGYATIAAMFVELFPARIRYTSMSIPYHIGTGWVGGLLPTTAFAIVAATGDIYSGLWYPIFFVGLCFIIGLFFLPETKGRSID